VAPDTRHLALLFVQQCSIGVEASFPKTYDAAMQVPTGHRKLVKHYENLGHARELTFSCYQRMPLLTNDCWREMLSRSIDSAADRHNWRLTAFVFMPEHVHLLFFPLPTAAEISELLKAIKRPFSYRIKQLLIEHHSPLVERLTIRQRPGVTTFRFWQEGPGYDRNLETEAALLAAIDYIHLNPVRRQLCDKAIDWRWSSIRFYEDRLAPADPALPKLHLVPPDFFC
jgi:putative transposase